MTEQIVDFKKALIKELDMNIVMFQAIDKECQKGEALVLDGKIQALQWALDTLNSIVLR